MTKEATLKKLQSLKMRKIEVSVLPGGHESPGAMMMFLARLTQRGHNMVTMDSLMEEYNKTVTNGTTSSKVFERVAALPHGTIKRFTPITIAITGASRRFLSQIRTHSVGLEFVSGSLQYSDYSDKAQFVVPYEITKNDMEYGLKHHNTTTFHQCKEVYMETCITSMMAYTALVHATGSNDAAGYAAPQGLRNVLIISGNHEAWMNLIRTRSCNRNTTETQYVTMLIWEALLGTQDGEALFKYAGPDCLHGKCREGKMNCLDNSISSVDTECGCFIPRTIINNKWPLLVDEEGED